MLLLGLHYTFTVLQFVVLPVLGPEYPSECVSLYTNVIFPLLFFFAVQVESRPYGVIYAVVTVRDLDEGENGLVDVKIKEGDPNGFFRIRSTNTRNEFYVEMSPVIASNFNPHREKTRNFNLTIEAVDRGTPKKTSLKVNKLNTLTLGSNGLLGYLLMKY